MKLRFLIGIIVLAGIGCPKQIQAQEPVKTAPGEEKEEATPAANAQQEQDTQSITPEQVEKYKEVKKAAKTERKDADQKEDKTGADPRAFSTKFMPFYRYTQLKNGMTGHDITAFGIIGFSPVVAMFYEVPLGQYRNFDDIDDQSNLPPEMPDDAIGMGDMNFKVLVKPKALKFNYGKEKKMSGNVMFGVAASLPTATSPWLASNAVLLAPIFALVMDMPLHGFLAMLNLYYFDVYRADGSANVNVLAGQWFYMQPLTKPGKWWGGFFLLPEFQPVYDFETKAFSWWVGVELGKVIVPGQVFYVKPGWGSGYQDYAEDVDRRFTMEVGARWFF